MRGMGELSEYIEGLEGAEHDVVERIRASAVELVPDAEEGKGYGMPALTYRGRPLLSVQIAKSHIGYYPFSPAVVEAVHDDLDREGFDWSKGTIRFQVEHPLPDTLVTRLVVARRDEIDAAMKR
jgi:uncharacterized protein YdhG (YjbR/CyaY superfamily)